MKQRTTQPIPKYEPMTEAEMEDYLDALYAEWLSKQEAYAFEDNYEPFETLVKPIGKRNHAGGKDHVRG